MILNTGLPTKDSIEEVCQEYKIDELGGWKLEECKEIQINGNNLVKKVQDNGNNTAIGLESLLASYSLYVNVIIPNDQSLDTRLEIINAMFSTLEINPIFKEHQPSPTENTTDELMTYTNVQYHFSVQYPKGWRMDENYLALVKNSLYIYIYPSASFALGKDIFDKNQTQAEAITISGSPAMVFSCPDKTPCPEQVSIAKIVRFTNFPIGWDKDNTIGYVRFSKDLTNFDQDNKEANAIINTFKFTK